MPDRYGTVLGVLFFVAILAAADRSLGRWGSAAIRRKPRPGGRITILFGGVFVICVLMEVLAAKLWSSAPLASVVVLVLQFPGAIGVALGLDRAVTALENNGSAPG